MKGYPRYFLSCLWGVMTCLVVTGLLLLPTTLLMRCDIELPWHLPGEARVAMALCHAVAAFFMLFVFGALWSLHMRSGWRRRLQRGSGGVLVLLLILLAVTALGVYYLGESTLADGAALAHAALSIVVAVPLTWHVMRGRRSR